MNNGTPTRRRPRYSREQRAQLASIDCLAIENFARQAQEALRDGELSVTLDHLEQVKKALARAGRMIRSGK